MNHTQLDWIDAYFDGELQPELEQSFTHHLQECETCRQELENRQLLRTELRSLAMATGEKPAQQFISEIMLHLPPQSSSVSQKASLRILWYVIPLGILLCFVGLQIFGWVTGLLDLIPGVNSFFALLFPVSAWGGEWFNWLSSVFQASIFWNGIGQVFEWNIFNQLFYLAVLAILYCSWMVLWWINRQPQTSQVS